MLIYIFVGTGAAIGGMLRYWLSDAVQNKFSPTLPYGTLVVNILGSFIIGIVMYYLNSAELVKAEMRMFLTAGICGGLTTFSTFSFETFNLFLDGEFLFAGLNIILNLFLTLVAIFISYSIAKVLLGG